MSFPPNSSLSTALAREIRAEMGRKRFTVADFARAIKVSYATASRRVSGATPLDVAELEKACAWLGLTVSELVERSKRGA